MSDTKKQNQNPSDIPGVVLKARRLRFGRLVETETGPERLPLSQAQFGELLGINVNTVAVNERRGFHGAIQRYRYALHDKAISWLEYRHGLVPWEDLSVTERRQSLDFAVGFISTRVTLSPEREARRARLASKKAAAKKASAKTASAKTASVKTASVKTASPRARSGRTAK